MKDKKLRFIGMGVSGGEEGALEGPSMMPGGERDAYARIEPMVTKNGGPGRAGTPCATYIGLGGAGHYVKMVHNGIEYADMQLITEAYDLFKTVYGLDASAIADIFEGWKTSELDSYLVDITTEVLKKRDAKTGGALVDSIVDEARAEGDRALDRRQCARTWRTADPASPKRSSPVPSRGGGSCAAKPKRSCPITSRRA